MSKVRVTAALIAMPKFYRGLFPEPSCWGGATARLLNSHLLGTPALRDSLGASGPPIVPQCLLAVDATGGTGVSSLPKATTQW